MAAKRPERIQHPTFGELRWEAGRECWFAHIRDAAGEWVEIAIAPEDDPPKGWLDRAAKLYTRVLGSERKLLLKAVRRELLELYNGTWARDGATLTEAALVDALELTTVLIGGGVPITLSYDAGDLFGGHAVDVELGGRLTILDVNLVG